jgi:hypothetical protein
VTIFSDNAYAPLPVTGLPALRLYFRRGMLAAKRPRVFLMETSRLLGSRNLRKTARSFRDL